jgi:hypothetical protein
VDVDIMEDTKIAIIGTFLLVLSSAILLVAYWQTSNTEKYCNERTYALLGNATILPPIKNCATPYIVCESPFGYESQIKSDEKKMEIFKALNITK